MSSQNEFEDLQVRTKISTKETDNPFCESDATFAL